MTERIDQQSPYVLAMIISDSIYIDPSNGKKSLLGMFSTVFGVNFPIRLPQIIVYAAMTDGRGKTPIKLQMIDADEERGPIFESRLEFDFTDPRLVAEIVSGFQNVEFPAAGEYRLQLFACDTLILERRIIVASPKENPNA